MGKIVITEVTGKTYYNVDFGDYSNQKNIPNSKHFWAEDILEVDIFDNKIIVELKETKADEWSVSNVEGSGILQIDSVLGVNPTDNDHLAKLISNLKG